MAVARRAIGEKLSGELLGDPNAGKKSGGRGPRKLGGKKGSKARAAALSPAKKAAVARWSR